MHRNIFGYILAHSTRQQLLVLAMTVCSLPFYYISLELPKRIVNQAIDAAPDGFPKALEFAGYSLVTLGQIEFLLTLCALFLLLVLINGGFKYAINVYKGLLGERMLRRLRYQLYALILRFPLAQFRRVSQGEMVSIVTSEVEPLGGFIGDAYALPLYQGGLLLTALVFIFVQDAVMGAAVIALYPVQAVIIPRLQFQVNQLGKQRVREVRRLSNRVTEAMSLAREIRANDIARYELAGFTGALARIFEIRYQIYRKKFFIKFLNNFIAQLTPFFFFSIGGYLVIGGGLTIGALVAVLAAYKDLAPPWKELLDYYQAQQDARIRYEQIVAQFDIPDLEPADVTGAPTADRLFPDGDLEFDHVGYSDSGTIYLADVSFTAGTGEHLAIHGDADSGKDTLALIAAGLIDPTTGKIRIGGASLESLPAGLIGRNIAFADREPALLTGTLLENITYGLKHDPGKQSDATLPVQLEALKTGNSLDDPEADWIDYAAAGVAESEQLAERALEALDVADLDGMLYEFALRTRIDIDSCPAIADKILSLRATLSERLSKQSLQALLIEPFDPQKYNPRISIAENLLFGKPIGEALDIRHLADNPVVRRVLKRSKMDATLIDFGHEIAQAAVSLAEQGITREEMASEYLPVAADEIPLFSLIVGLAARAGPERLPRGYKRTLESLALRANPARHRQIVIPPPLQTQILSARLTIKERLSAQLSAMIEFFDPAAYNSALTIRENIIFGEIASNDATASRRVNDAILEISEGEDLRSLLKQLGLSFQVGTGGSNLSPVQQQKLGIARAVIKRPKVLVMSNALTGLDTASIERIHSGLTREMTGRIILCHTGDARVAALFERTIELRSGRVITDSANVTDAHS